MHRGFTVEAADVNVVGSVEEFRTRLNPTPTRPPVHKSAREILPGAPPPRTLSEVFFQEPNPNR